jgi:SAM-dependent methyltransferase
VSFFASADAYGQFMGRFSEPLAGRFVELLRVGPGRRVLDVGCGPGALTRQLVNRVGSASVTAVDPSEPFVDAVRGRLPEVDVQVASAEHLPFGAGTFDVAAAQLVVHFMRDPVAGLAEMGRVTAPGGVVAACVWDQAGGAGPLSLFWDVVHAIDPLEHGEADLPGARKGHLGELFAQAALTDIEETSLTVEVSFRSFDEWWHAYTLGVGPAGAYVAALNEEGRDELRRECAERLPRGAFTLAATAWCATGSPSG